jgi:hypothetical protein
MACAHDAHPSHRGADGEGEAASVAGREETRGRESMHGHGGIGFHSMCRRDDRAHLGQSILRRRTVPGARSPRSAPRPVPSLPAFVGANAAYYSYYKTLAC